MRSTRRLGELLRAAKARPAPGSTAASDAKWDDTGWVPGSGSGSLAISCLLLSGANAVLIDLGDLVGSARGPVTAPTLCRYVLEHVAELHWILSPGSYQAGASPEPELSPEEHNMVKGVWASVGRRLGIAFMVRSAFGPRTMAADGNGATVVASPNVSRPFTKRTSCTRR